MPCLGQVTQILKDGLLSGETNLLELGATQGLPIQGSTQDKHLPEPTRDRDLQEPTLDRDLLGPILDRRLLGLTLDRHLLALTLDKHLLGPTLAQRHLLILGQLDQGPTPGNQVVELGPTHLLDSQALLELTLALAPSVPLLDL